MIHSRKIKGELFPFINLSVSYFKFPFRPPRFGHQFDTYVTNNRFPDHNPDNRIRLVDGKSANPCSVHSLTTREWLTCLQGCKFGNG